MAANGVFVAPPRSAKALPASEAVAFLEKYSRGDGLSLAELMDSRKNGGLTYNDFLMLPGHIAFPVSRQRAGGDTDGWTALAGTRR